ncbi:MAG: hypothetical protein WA715_23125 [Candidatus Acidiferrum sp.]
MKKTTNGNPNLNTWRRQSYPIGLFVRVRMTSGREIDAQILKVETTALGTFLHVEFEQEVANVVLNQIVGFYDFCYLKRRLITHFGI